MAGLTIAWRYLTGYAVATDPANRECVEWPPHPARVFMAMAAAWFETGEPEDEGDALHWLETIGAPRIAIPPESEFAERSLVTQYVPVNDKAGPSVATLQTAPALTRSKQARQTPKRWIGDAVCALHWPTAAPSPSQVESLGSVCEKVTRIGHSSSLVQVWVEENHLDLIDSDEKEWLNPSENALQASFHLRGVSVGLLDSLPAQTQIPRIQRFAEFERLIGSCKGKELKQVKADYENEFNERWRSASKPPALLRPSVRTEVSYQRAKPVVTEGVRSYFDPDLVMLRRVGGPRLPVTAALQVTRVLRKAVMETSLIQPVPGWLSGHTADGEKSVDDAGHVAFVPLPFVGHKHADGSLLGVAIVFPSAWQDQRERGRAIGPLLVDNAGAVKPFTLTLGALGEWRLEKADWSEQRHTLQPTTWTASPKGERTWASATPVVLDRFPKADRKTDRNGWTDQVAEIVATACERIGLPRPLNVEVDTTSWISGAPRAVGKRRPLRGKSGPDATAALGDGFPAYPAKGTGSPRPQVHVRLEFGEPVVGPLLLGAGRFLGYGLCRPIRGSQA